MHIGYGLRAYSDDGPGDASTSKRQNFSSLSSEIARSRGHSESERGNVLRTEIALLVRRH